MKLELLVSLSSLIKSVGTHVLLISKVGTPVLLENLVPLSCYKILCCCPVI